MNLQQQYFRPIEAKISYPQMAQIFADRAE
jgi:hypothetical protein